jgi:hypothetical protein
MDFPIEYRERMVALALPERRQNKERLRCATASPGGGLSGPYNQH